MRLSTFRAEITPQKGHPLCAGWYPPMVGVEHSLYANGVILYPADDLPIVLCALDWAELSNLDHVVWRERLGAAVGTVADRVAVHCIHAHDSPWPDTLAQRILDGHGSTDVILDYSWCESAVESVAKSAVESVGETRTVTGLSVGSSQIEGLASNRRIIGADGKSKGVRWTRCYDPLLRDEPEGLIDPDLRSLAFWDGDEMLAALHYYTVHPTSYDGTGYVTSDFVGVARERLSEKQGVPHLYFTQCAGNITTGKYNDGNPDLREVFTEKIRVAMHESLRCAQRVPVTEPAWGVSPVYLPPRMDDSDETLLQVVRSSESTNRFKSRAALFLTYRQRSQAEFPILLQLLSFGPGIHVLHLPSEAFVEYQIFAQQLRPDAWVAVPAYGDCGPGYIPLERSFAEGGYEPTDAFCSPECEANLRGAIVSLLSSLP